MRNQMLLIGVATFVAIQPAARAATPTSVVITPYTVRLVQRMQAPDGVATLVFTTAQRTDGSLMKTRELFGADGNLRSSERTVELAAGTVASINSVSRLRTTTFDSSRNWRTSTRTPGSRCLRSLMGTKISPAEVDAGNDKQSGFDVVKITESQNTLWLAPSLGCAILRAEYGPNQRAAEKVIPGEPDAGLFDLGGSFNEVPPSVFFNLPRGREASDRDAFYLSHRPRGTGSSDP